MKLLGDKLQFEAEKEVEALKKVCAYYLAVHENEESEIVEEFTKYLECIEEEGNFILEDEEE